MRYALADMRNKILPLTLHRTQHWSTDLNILPDTTKSPEENIRNTLKDTGIRKDLAEKIIKE